MRSVRKNTCAEVKANRACRIQLNNWSFWVTRAHLCGNICERCLCHKPHAVNTHIARTCGLWLLIHGSGGCKNLLERLWSVIVSYNKYIDCQYLLLRGGHCAEGHSKGLQSHMYSSHTRRLAIGPQPLVVRHSQAWCGFYASCNDK